MPGIQHAHNVRRQLPLERLHGNPARHHERVRRPVLPIPFPKHNPPHTRLDNLLRTQHARKQVRVQRRASTTFATSLDDSVLLRMQTEAQVERGPLDRVAVAAGTAAVAAVYDAGRGAVVAGRDDAIVARDDAAYAAFHAVCSLAGEAGERHEVPVPAWSEAGAVEEVDGGESCVEVWHAAEVISDVQARVRGEVRERARGRAAVVPVRADEIG